MLKKEASCNFIDQNYRAAILSPVVVGKQSNA